MADVKISALPASTTPLAGTEVLPIVQSSTTRQVSVANLTAGRAVNALSITASSLTSGRVTYAGASGLLTDSANLTFDGTKLDVQNNGDATARSYSTNASNQSFIQAVNSSNIYIGLLQYGASKAVYGALGAGGGALYSVANVTVMADNPTGFINFATGGNTERMRITSAGVVGIGTSSPDASYRLNLSGTSTILPAIYFNNTTSSKDYSLRVSGTDFILRDNTSGNDRLYVDTSGNLLVGTTSGSAKLTVYGTGSASAPRGAAWIYTTNASDLTYCAMRVSKTDNNVTTSQVYIQFDANAGASGNGQINGNGANAAAFGSFSDSRLKENITDLPSQLNSILALKPKEFDYIESEGGGHQIGFIAQEMQEVYPDVVGKRPDEMLTITGWSKTEARLVKAIQEQQALIESLTARLTALENK